MWTHVAFKLYFSTLLTGCFISLLSEQTLEELTTARQLQKVNGRIEKERMGDWNGNCSLMWLSDGSPLLFGPGVTCEHML